MASEQDSWINSAFNIDVGSIASSAESAVASAVDTASSAAASAVGEVETDTSSAVDTVTAEAKKVVSAVASTVANDGEAAVSTAEDTAGELWKDAKAVGGAIENEVEEIPDVELLAQGALTAFGSKPPVKPPAPTPPSVPPSPKPAPPPKKDPPSDPPDPPPPGPGTSPTGGQTVRIKGGLHVNMNSLGYSGAMATVSCQLPGADWMLGAVMITGGAYTWGGIPWKGVPKEDGGRPLPDPPLEDPGPIQLSIVLLSDSGQIAAKPAGTTLQGGRDHAPLPVISFRNVACGKSYTIRFQIPSDPPDQPRGIPLNIWFELTGWTPGA